MQKHLESTL